MVKRIIGGCDFGVLFLYLFTQLLNVFLQDVFYNVIRKTNGRGKRFYDRELPLPFFFFFKQNNKIMLIMRTYQIKGEKRRERMYGKWNIYVGNNFQCKNKLANLKKKHLNKNVQWNIIAKEFDYWLQEIWFYIDKIYTLTSLFLWCAHFLQKYLWKFSVLMLSLNIC